MAKFLASITLFEFTVIATVLCWVWAVFHGFDATRLGIIGGTVGLSVWGRIRGQTN